MIIHSVCSSCLRSFNLMVEPTDIQLVKEIADDEGNTCPCPSLCGGSINLVGPPTVPENVHVKAPINLTGRQLYQAVNGLGLPEELPRTVESVEKALVSHVVTKVVVEEHQGKVYLHEFHLATGDVLHLASGSKGAQVLRIVKGESRG